MPHLLSANFKFHPVGQGCFYSGDIINNNHKKKFTLVFDCGTISSKKYLDNSISVFKSTHDKIDLLIISHFDEDHVNGVAELLNGISCDTVIIPYYSPLLRLGLFASNESSNPDYDLFLRSPMNYFLQEKFKISNIIVIGNDKEGNTEGSQNSIPIEPEGNLTNETLDFDFENIENNSNFSEYIRQLEGNNFNSDKKLKYLPFPFTLSFRQKFWVFKFYLKYFNETIKVTNFNTEIDNLMQSIKSTNILDLFDNVSIRASVRKAYTDTINGNVNYSSLILFHGPTITKSWACISNCCNNYFDDFFPEYCEYKKTGTLLTGDSFLKTNIDFNPFFDYFSNPINNISNCFILQVPHHGSNANWKRFPNGLEQIPFYVINHGIGRSKHPSREVLDDFIYNTNINRLKFNNEGEMISYIIHCYR